MELVQCFKCDLYLKFIFLSLTSTEGNKLAPEECHMWLLCNTTESWLPKSSKSFQAHPLAPPNWPKVEAHFSIFPNSHESCFALALSIYHFAIYYFYFASNQSKSNLNFWDSVQVFPSQNSTTWMQRIKNSQTYNCGLQFLKKKKGISSTIFARREAIFTSGPRHNQTVKSTTV